MAQPMFTKKLISAMDPVLDWQVHNAKDYPTFTVEDDDHLSLGVSLYIPLDPNHRNDGEFRLAILGGDDEEVCVPAIDVYHTLPQAVADTMLHFAFSSIKKLIPSNCTSCPWQDATSLIRNVALLHINDTMRSGIGNHNTQIRTDPDPCL